MEDTKFKLWGLVNLFFDADQIILAKGALNTSYNSDYGSFTTIEKGSIFKPCPGQDWYFRELDKPIKKVCSLDIKVPEDTWLLYYRQSGQYYSMYNQIWDVMAVRVLNELEYFDYVYHN